MSSCQKDILVLCISVIYIGRKFLKQIYLVKDLKKPNLFSFQNVKTGKHLSLLIWSGKTMIKLLRMTLSTPTTALKCTAMVYVCAPLVFWVSLWTIPAPFTYIRVSLQLSLIHLASWNKPASYCSQSWSFYKKHFQYFWME